MTLREYLRRRGRNARRAILAVATLIVSAACDLFGPETLLRIIVPPPPEHWVRTFHGLSYRIVFQDASGKEHELDVGDRRSLPVIPCGKAGNTPVLAWPVIQDREGREVPGLLRPAGGLYPLDLDPAEREPTLVLSWENGCVAWIISMLWKSGMDASLLNAERLAQRLREPEDPWEWDSESMAERLARGHFSSYDITALPKRDVRLQPGAGEWFLESPFSQVTTVEDGQTLELADMSLGMHSLFAVGGEMARVFIGERETVITFIQ